jgi:hypothetical protein
LSHGENPTNWLSVGEPAVVEVPVAVEPVVRRPRGRRPLQTENEAGSDNEDGVVQGEDGTTQPGRLHLRRHAPKPLRYQSVTARCRGWEESC